ncbi:ATP-dependent protease ATPase subunit HslU [Lysinibacillus sp. FSL M8-0216]|uniref:ATP-dependent protease ATPase subunit HslU n=1 Tax=Lysinibacillus fusiformis TaxID=28031 RepID=A0A1H9D9A8_9BACI|nr:MULTISPECIES: ATP-dependent protease ATPase subunit HslU [Lysinibacillus]EAZ83587.1 ATP-dependent protease ATP-binding subunit [Bacillus sp. B14905]MCG7434209.1 ATP-dependent protease ATPase subunit HslU [Lysinibacillus fusiformis]MED4074830.1 ATP-dependent protease ATPase subunit HslU [Lysinibacillus fusiformis]MED4668645.1 ATP-dependent protease ATPase subunit HslU [Lysinibacillus fusiformis]PCD83731.1 ATP-dependent protease ATPase subunit HslU [Lysinibacillus fusiformis]
MTQKNLTPRQITEHLDRYIVGQNEAKRAVAIALRNRYRRSLLNEDMKAEVIPKNILMIGPTGVGKTEIARRIAKLTNAPFVKVEATKFTEVGYVGRDVESMVRDLVEASHRLVKEEMMESVKEQAEQLANEAIVKLLVPSLRKKQSMQNPFEMLFGGKEQTSTDDTSSEETEVRSKRAQIAIDLRNGKLENEWITVEVTEQTPSIFDALQGTGMDMSANNGMQDMLSSLMPKKQKKRRVQVKDARRILTIEEANKLIDADEVAQESIVRAEQTGIIFIDEIDKIASKEGNSSANVSREGVQRDILPIVEGSTVTTKYGAVKTDYMLFIAAGAFHMSKPSDLIPELQGRFPIRVELEKLTKQDFVRILQEPDQSLILQYKALLETEGVEINFTSDAIERIAEIATEVNQETDNIGARRLHTILERLLEELSFEAAEIAPASIPINAAYVDQKLAGIVKNKDLSQFIL